MEYGTYEQFLARNPGSSISRDNWEKCLGPNSQFAEFNAAKEKELAERVYIGTDGVGKTGAELWPPNGIPRPFR